MLVTRALSVSGAPIPSEAFIDDVLASFKAYYLAHPCVHSVLLPGAREVLDEAHAEGLPLRARHEQAARRHAPPHRGPRHRVAPRRGLGRGRRPAQARSRQRAQRPVASRHRRRRRVDDRRRASGHRRRQGRRLLHGPPCRASPSTSGSSRAAPTSCSSRSTTCARSSADSLRLDDDLFEPRAHRLHALEHRSELLLSATRSRASFGSFSRSKS